MKYCSEFFGAQTLSIIESIICKEYEISFDFVLATRGSAALVFVKDAGWPTDDYDKPLSWVIAEMGINLYASVGKFSHILWSAQLVIRLVGSIRTEKRSIPNCIAKIRGLPGREENIKTDKRCTMQCLSGRGLSE